MAKPLSNNYKRFLILAILILASLFVVSENAYAADLELTVSYGEIKCGEPTVFTLSGPVGNGNYQYRISDGYLYRVGGVKDEIVDPSQYNKAPLAFTADNTIEFTFYASGTYELYFYIMDMDTYKTARKTLILNVYDLEYPDIDTVADNIATECLKTCTTDYEKALWLHDWLVDNVTYNYTYCSAEGALVRGLGSCNAYHNAYVMLLNRVGVECGESIGNGHIWTAVKMDGDWYQVDVTWDDPGYSIPACVNYLYFGLTDEMMQTVHSEHVINDAQRSNHYENNYFIKSGAIKQWADPLAAKIQTELDKGETEFTVTLYESQPIAFRKIYFNLCAWELENRDWTAGEKGAILSIVYEGLSDLSAADNNRMHVKATSFDNILLDDGAWHIRKGLLTGESYLIIAEYSVEGKMLSVEIIMVDPEKKGALHGTYTIDTKMTYKMFLTNKKFLIYI